MRIAFLRFQFIGEVESRRIPSDACFQRAFDAIARKIVAAAKVPGFEQRPRFFQPEPGQGLKVNAVHIGSGAGHVGALGGVDPNLLAFVDEGWNLDDEAGFGLRGLGDGGGGS